MDRKGLIRAAAIELFAERGFQATPTAEVAKRAGVSEGVIFYHFGTKDGIIINLFEEIIHDFIDRVRQALETAPTGLEAVLSVVRLKIAMSQERQQESLVLARDMPVSFNEPNSSYQHKVEEATSTLVDLFRQAVQAGVADGSIRSCDPERTAFILLGALIGVSRLHLSGIQPHIDFDDELLDFCLHALAPGRDTAPSPIAPGSN